VLTSTERILGAGSALAALILVAIDQVLLGAAAAIPMGVLVFLDRKRASPVGPGGDAVPQEPPPGPGRAATLPLVLALWPAISAITVFGLGALAEDGRENVSVGLAVPAAVLAIALSLISLRRSAFDQTRTGWLVLISGTLAVGAFAAIWAVLGG
jgi:hypothetical protein